MNNYKFLVLHKGIKITLIHLLGLGIWMFFGETPGVIYLFLCSIYHHTRLVIGQYDLNKGQYDLAKAVKKELNTVAGEVLSMNKTIIFHTEVLRFFKEDLYDDLFKRRDKSGRGVTGTGQEVTLSGMREEAHGEPINGPSSRHGEKMEREYQYGPGKQCNAVVPDPSHDVAQRGAEQTVSEIP